MVEQGLEFFLQMAGNSAHSVFVNLDLEKPSCNSFYLPYCPLEILLVALKDLRNESSFLVLRGPELFDLAHLSKL
ncbi:hypothetical protein HNQ76_001429 [Thermosulfuriphilus ammonigenes]|nr:hypothetical protein [Thermosulfuriphilus ammonigenes]